MAKKQSDAIEDQPDARADVRAKIAAKREALIANRALDAARRNFALSILDELLAECSA